VLSTRGPWWIPVEAHTRRSWVDDGRSVTFAVRAGRAIVTLISSLVIMIINIMNYTDWRCDDRLFKQCDTNIITGMYQ